MTENEKDKKKFISEKIVGRPFGLKRAAGLFALSVSCGLLFGAAAVGGGIFVLSLSEGEGSYVEADADASAGEIEDKETGSENSPGGKGGTQEKPSENGEQKKDEKTYGDKEPEDKAADQGKNSEKGIEDESKTPEKKAESGEPADFEAIISEVARITAEAQKCIVTVKSVSSDRGWFNDPVNTVDNYSGLIISKKDGNIDILTTEKAVINADSMEIAFANGADAEASFIQASHYDNIAVIRVKEESLLKEELSGIEAVTWGNAAAAEPGDFVIAAGAPLGAVHSFDYGFINFTYDNAPSPDDEIKRIYTSLKSDVELGTFVLDKSGKFIGFAQSEGEEGENSVWVASASNYKHMIERLCMGREIQFIGIKGQEVTEAMKESGIPEGVYVTDVITDSPAYAAGLKRGDIITSLADNSCRDMSEFRVILNGLEYESNVEIKAFRQSVGNEYRKIEFNMPVGAR